MSQSNAEGRPSLHVAPLALIFAIVGAASMTYYHLRIFIPHAEHSRVASSTSGGYVFGNDFYPVWLTARTAGTSHSDPYSAEMTREIQTGLFGHPITPRNTFDPPADYRQFAYPAFTDLILWPAAELKFPQLRLILAVLLPLLTIASIWLWFKALDWPVHPVWFMVFLLLALSSYQLLEAFFAEQPSLIVGFFLAAAADALRRNRLMLAGALSSLTLIKPQMTALLIFYLLIWSFTDRRRARFWQGFFAVTIVLLAASLWVWPHWLREWVTILLGYHRYATPPLISVLFGKGIPGYVGMTVIACVLIGAALCAWKNRRASADSPSFWFTVSILLAITAVTLLPGQAVYDHVILLPGILLVIKHHRNLLTANWLSRALLAVGAVVMFWSWLASLALIVFRPLFSPEFFGSNLVTLPIRTAAPLPFSVLAMVWWTSRLRSAKTESA